MLDRLILTNFTAFSEIDLPFSPGVNVFIGANGTGKTHILKVLYAGLSAAGNGGEAIQQSKGGSSFQEKLLRVFLPEGGLHRLAHRKRGRVGCSVEITGRQFKQVLQFGSRASDEVRERRRVPKSGSVPTSSYIPVKEMLANAPGFRSLYAAREIHFEAVYADLVDKAYLPLLRGKPDKDRNELLTQIQKLIEGSVVLQGEVFYLKNQQGNLEFTLLAEGMRKLGLLWLLIQNGSLSTNSVLFWDEPEANLNPSMIRELVIMLLRLQSAGVQIFLATHSYVVLKELGLQRREKDNLSFFQLSRSDSGMIICNHGPSYESIVPNRILDAYDLILEDELSNAAAGNHRERK